jgi:hypothetical protein
MKDRELALAPTLERVLVALGIQEFVPDRTAIRQVIAEIEADLLRVAVDAHHALAVGVGFPDAVGDDANYPHLRRFHLGAIDMLTVGLDPRLQEWARRVLAARESPIAEEFRSWLTKLATDRSQSPVAQALARFVLFEAVRLNLVIVAWNTGGAFEAENGRLEDLDRIAEAAVASAVAARSDGPPAPSLEDLVRRAVERMRDYASDLHVLLSEVAEDVAQAAQEQAALEAAVSVELRKLDSADALLLRNRVAPDLDEQRLSIELLTRDHPLVLGTMTRAAADQRVSRLLRRLRERGPAGLPGRKQPSLIDLFEDADAEEGEPQR